MIREAALIPSRQQCWRTLVSHAPPMRRTPCREWIQGSKEHASAYGQSAEQVSGRAGQGGARQGCGRAGTACCDIQSDRDCRHSCTAIPHVPAGTAGVRSRQALHPGRHHRRQGGRQERDAQGGRRRRHHGRHGGGRLAGRRRRGLQAIGGQPEVRAAGAAAAGAARDTELHSKIVHSALS